MVTEDFIEIFKKYDNKELELEECTEQLRATLLKLIQSADVTGRHRSNVREAFIALDINFEDFEEAVRRKKAGVPGADEHLNKVTYDLKRSIESIRDLMLYYVNKSSVTPLKGTEPIIQPKVDIEDSTEKQYIERIQLAPDDDIGYSALGKYYFSKERYEDAIKQYEIAASKNERAIYYSNIGDAYSRLAMWDESIRFYEKALALDPEDDLVYNNLGNAYYGKGNYEDAMEYYLKAIKYNSEPVYYTNMGMACSMQNKFDEAIEYLETALAINPKHTPAHVELAYAKLSKYNSEEPSESVLLQEALDHYKETFKIDPSEFNYFDYTCLGEVYYKLGKLDEAIENYKKSIELDPRHSRAYNGLGTVYFGKGEFHNALEYYKKALENKPDYYIYADNIGSCYKKLKEWDQAIMYYKKALDLNPKDSIALGYLGEVYYNINKYDEASKYLDEAIKMEPNNFLHYDSMGMVLSAQKQWDRAISYFKKGIELNPQDHILYYDLSLAYFEKGLLREAADMLTKAANIKPDPIYYDRLSEAYSRLRMWNEAIKYAKLADENAKKRDPNDDSYSLTLSNVYNLKGLYLYSHGQHKEAIDEYKNALSIKEDDVYYWNIYLAYKAQNDIKEAKKCLLKAIKLNPNEKKYMDHMERL